MLSSTVQWCAMACTRVEDPAKPNVNCVKRDAISGGQVDISVRQADLGMIGEDKPFKTTTSYSGTVVSLAQ